MNRGKYIFVQIAGFLPRRAFDYLAEKYPGIGTITTTRRYNHSE